MEEHKDPQIEQEISEKEQDASEKEQDTSGEEYSFLQETIKDGRRRRTEAEERSASDPLSGSGVWNHRLLWFLCRKTIDGENL